MKSATLVVATLFASSSAALAQSLPVPVVHAASFPSVSSVHSMIDSRVKRMAPGMIADITGDGFLPAGTQQQCDIAVPSWPTSCGGVTVKVNGHAAVISFVLPKLIRIQIPFEVAPGAAAFVVERSAGTEVARSAPFNVTVETYSPTLATNAEAKYAGVDIQAIGGASRTNPLLPGDTVILYVDGFGQTDPPMVTGSPVLQLLQTLSMPSVTIAGKPLQDVRSLVLPAIIGQYRVYATVPRGLGSGDLPISVEIGGVRSQDGLVVPVASEPLVNAVTNAASGAIDIVSGSWVTLYGRNLSATSRSWGERDIDQEHLPTTLDDVQVDINGAPAVVAYVSPSQLNVLAPDNLPLGPVDVLVKRAGGTNKTTANVKSWAPGLFALTWKSLLAFHADWSYVAKAGQLPSGLPWRSAKPGEIIVFYATGLGPTNPFVSMYSRFAGSVPVVDASLVKVQIGSKPAEVRYAGLISNGLYQLNVVVPDLLDGDHDVIVSVGQESSPAGRNIPVQR